MLAPPASPTPSVWRRLAIALPAGTLALALGFVANGVTVFAFLLLPRLSHRLPGASLSALQALWFIVFLITPGVFGPLEHATNARVAARRAHGSSDRDAIRAAARTTARLCALVTVIAVAISPILVPRAFEHDRSFVAWLVLALTGNGVLFWIEGVVSGRRGFGLYARLIAFEGGVRLLGALVLVVGRVDSASAYGALVAVTPWFTIAFAAYRDPDLGATLRRNATASHSAVGARSNEADFETTVLGLLGGQLALQALLNIAPIAATLLADPADKPLVADLGTLFIVCRIPLFLYQALAITLLTELSGLAAIGKQARLRQVALRVIAGIGVIGAIFLGALSLSAKSIGRLLLGPATEIGRSDWLVVAAANVVAMIGLTVSVALVAQRRVGRSGIGWATGFAVATLFIVVTTGSRSIVDRVTLAYAMGVLAATGTLSSFVLTPAERPSA